MPTLDYVEGFEHQTASILQLGGTGVGIFETVNRPAGTSFVAGRTGGFAMQIVQDGATSSFCRRDLVASQQRVVALYFLVSAAPSVLSAMFEMRDAANGVMATFQLNTNGTMRGRVGGAGVQTSADNVCNGQWHRLVFWLDSSGTTWTLHWSIDGTAQTNATEGTHVATSSVRILYGSATGANTATVIYDDVIAGVLSADYPYQTHIVRGAVPNADGSHNPETNVIEDESGVDISAGVAFGRLDEWPANNTDYVRQNASGSGNYAEVGFENKDVTVASVWAVQATVALFASTTTAETGTPTTRIVDSAGDTLVDVFSGDQSETALHYRSALVPAPIGAWTDGFDGVKARVGFRSDAVGGHPRWSALILQYAIPSGILITGAATVAGAGAFSATSTGVKTGAAAVAGTGVFVAAGVVVQPEAPGLGIALGVVSTGASQAALNGGINASVLTINVTSSPGSGYRDLWNQPYIIEIDNERILIQSSTATVLTVATGGRGYQDTTAASHSSGAQARFSYIVDRGSTPIIDQSEAQVAIDAPDPGFRYGNNRDYYLFMDTPLPVARLNIDHGLDRLPLVSWKVTHGGFTWRQAADAASGTLYNQIRARGVEIAAWQATVAGTGRWGRTFAWTMHHEPNNGDQADAAISGSSNTVTGKQNWRDMMENIETIWAGVGVVFWDGDLGQNTTTEGLITGINLTWAPDGGNSELAGLGVGDLWWPNSWTWGNAHMKMFANDAYNRGPNWRRFARHMGASEIPGGVGNFKAWTDAKRITQGAAGHPLLAMIWETGCGEGKVGAAAALPFSTGGFSTGQYSNTGADWSNVNSPTATVIQTKAHWLDDMRNFIRDFWPELFAISFFDSYINSITEWQVDTTQEAWDGWVDITQDPIFAPELPAAAPTAVHKAGGTFGSSTSFTVSSVVLETKPTLITVVSAHATVATIPTIANTHSTPWTQVATVESNTTAVRRRTTTFVGYPVAGTATIVVAFGGVTQDGGSVQIAQWTDAHISDLIVASKTQAGLAFGAVTAAFTLAPTAGNSVYVGVGLNNNVGLSPGAGYTGLGDVIWGTPVSSALTAYIGSNDQPADFVIDGTTAFQYAAIAIEIRATDGREVIVGAAAVAGAGAIVASGLVQPGTATIVTGAAAVAGAGDVSATGVLGLAGAADVAGAGGVVVASTVRVRLGVAGVVGAGAFVASAFGITPPLQASAQVFGHGVITATGFNLAEIKQGSAMLGGAALWNATGVVSRPPTMVVGKEHDLMGGPIPPTPSSW